MKKGQPGRPARRRQAPSAGLGLVPHVHGAQGVLAEKRGENLIRPRQNPELPTSGEAKPLGWTLCNPQRRCPHDNQLLIKRRKAQEEMQRSWRGSLLWRTAVTRQGEVVMGLSILNGLKKKNSAKEQVALKQNQQTAKQSHRNRANKWLPEGKKAMGAGDEEGQASSYKVSGSQG